MWDIVMGQGLGQLLPPPPSTTTTSSPTIVVRTPPQSDGVSIQSHNSGSVDASPDKSPPIPPSIAADVAESNTSQHPAALSIAADAAESLNFGTNTLQHPAAITQCMHSGCTVKPTAKPDKVQPIPSSIAADAAESLNFGTNTLQHPACVDSGCTVKPTAKPDKAPCPTVESLGSKLKTITLVQKPDGASIQFGDLGCTVKPTAKPDKAPHPTVESLISKLKALTLVQKPDGASIKFGDLGCGCSKSDKVLGTTPSIFDAIEDAAGDFSGLDDASPKSDKVRPSPPSTANFVESLSMKFAGCDDNAKFNTLPSTVNAVEYGSTILEVKPTGWEDEEVCKKAVPMTKKDGDGEGVKYPTGWEDEEMSKKAVPMTNKDGDGEGVKYPTGWEDEEMSKKAVPMTNKDGDSEGEKYPTGWEDEEISKKAVPMTNKDGDGEGVKYPTGWEDEEISKKAVPMTNKGGNGEDGVKYPTWWGVEVKPTGWEDEEISKKAVLMTNKDGNGEEVKYPTWCGVEVKPTGWEDEDISKKAVLMTNKDGNSEEVKYPTWCGVEVKPTGWGDEEVSKKAVPMTNKDGNGEEVKYPNKDGNGEGVKYPTWTTGWEDGERPDKAFLKPNKDGSCEGVKYLERSAVKYPERPGQPDCSFYVHTGICKFGLNCKFNHPATRRTRAKAKPKKPPEPIQMGISKLPMTSNTEEPVLGSSAPFHCPPAVTAAAEACSQSKILEEELEGKSHGDCYHSQRPEGKLTPEESISSKEGKSETDFPQRPGKPDCSYYLNTGDCQFGSNCRFNHPSRRKGNKKEVKEHIKNSPLGKTGNPESKADKGKQSKTFLGRTGQTERKINTRQYSVPGGNKSGTSSRNAHFPGKTEPGPVELNFLGLPIRPGERECANYMRTGVCKFATNCRFHHPNPTPVTAEDTLSASQQHAASPQQHASGASPLPTTSWTLPNASCGPLPYPSPLYTPGFYPLPSQGIYPHPGWSEYQVPTIPSFPPELVSGNSSTSKMNSGHEHVRPGQAACHSFARTGYCKFKSACRYCHPKGSPESTDGSESTL